MPKRPSTPPTVASCKYFTIHRPFPEPHLELEGHQKEVAFWISNMLGDSHPLIGMYHKPKSDKIIIEIKEEYGHWRRILGEHRWGEFLKNPTPEDAGLHSQVFFCTVDNDRDIQKRGWKHVPVRDKWFSEWRLNNSKIMSPYPLTHFCEVPPESTATQQALCRPLPVEYFPRMVPKPHVESARTAPPGSLTYAEEKLKLGGAWSKGSSSIKAAAQSASRTAYYAAPPSLSYTTSGNSRSNSSAGNGNTSSPLPAPTPVTPSLPRLNTEASSSSGQSYATPTSIPTPALSPDAAKDSSEGESVRMTPITPESAAIETTMSGLGVSNDPSSEDYDELDDDWGVPMAATVSEYTKFSSAAGEEVVENLWADYGTDQQPAETNPSEIICDQHGKLCRKGICTVYKKQMREAERRKQEAEKKDWRNSKTDKNSNERSTARGRGAKVVFSPGRQQRSRPPHLVNPTSTSSVPPTENQDEASSPGGIANTNTGAGTRQRPAHLSRPSAAPAADPDAPRPARARRQNSNNPMTAPNVSASPASAVDPTGWGHIGRTPWGGSVGTPSVSGKVPDDAKSAAASSTGGWGNPPRGPWDAASAAGARDAKKQGKAKGGNKSWADQMEDEDDFRSVAESSTGGWGTVPKGPWA